MKTLKRNVCKQVLQIGTLLLIIGFILKVLFGGEPADVEAYCPFGGLQSLATYLNSETLACSMSVVQITMGITLAICVLLFSRLFCGYVCPLGTLSEWLGKAGQKMKINRVVPVSSLTDKALRIIKYILLFWIFYMTLASSELFCKNFDPYYAAATGFQGEITLWMALISLTVFIFGNLCIRMFWCKYICPLGALSNIFKFTLTFLLIVFLSWLLNSTGIIRIPLIWSLGIACLLAYAFEIMYRRSKIFPLLRIERHTEKCNECGLCTKRCPHAIDLKKEGSIQDIDCTLCGECISSCHQNALTINGNSKLRWVPALAVILLFVLGLAFSNCWELPTINERWGDPAKHAHLAMLEKDGMRTVKCYGSSKAFSAKMQHVPGVYGVTTYVGRFAVQVYYDPEETTPEKIEEAMFTPTKRKLLTPPAEVQQLKIVTLGVENLFDRMDIVYLGNMIREHEGFYGILSEYDCPVRVKLFMDINKSVDSKEIRSIVEAPFYNMPQPEGKFQQIECNFRLVSISEQIDTLGRQEFLEFMFPAARHVFDKDVTETAVYEIEYPHLDLPYYQNMFPYFASFLSNQKGIVACETALKGEIPVIRITYDKNTGNDETLWKMLQSPEWTIQYSDGTTENMKAAYSFKTPGHTLNIQE